MSRDKVGTVDLDPKLFGVRVKPSVVHEVLVMQLASRRQGTAATKEKGDVSGGGKKPWKQKGTGRARVGSNRSPLWRGGGTIFGPHPRRYGYRLPGQKSRLALQGALSAKAAAGEVVVLDRLQVESAKTKTIAAMMKGLGLEERALVVVDQPSDALRRAARNHPLVGVLPLSSLNLYDVLRHRYLITTQDDLPRWSERWA
ncbi:MAG TPA: 50S ribosomal protein L4 [Nitrospiria bacterium]|nr:50S ribosomal protein L4 [Nitrospiria bacterium]